MPYFKLNIVHMLLLHLLNFVKGFCYMHHISSSILGMCYYYIWHTLSSILGICYCYMHHILSSILKICKNCEQKYVDICLCVSTCVLVTSRGEFYLLRKSGQSRIKRATHSSIELHRCYKKNKNTKYKIQMKFQNTNYE